MIKLGLGIDDDGGDEDGSGDAHKDEASDMPTLEEAGDDASRMEEVD
jgi:hypothetical protein